MLLQTGAPFRTIFGSIKLAKTPEFCKPDGSEMRVELDVDLKSDEAVTIIRDLLGSFDFIVNRKDLQVKRKCKTVLIVKTGKQFDSSKKQTKVNSEKGKARSATFHAVEIVMAAANRAMKEHQRNTAPSIASPNRNSGTDTYKNDTMFVGSRK